MIADFNVEKFFIIPWGFFEYIYIPKLGPGIFFFLLALLYQPYLINDCMVYAFLNLK